MVHSAAVVAVKKPRGRPFQKGADPRRNAGGRVPAPFTKTLLDKLDQATMNKIVEVWIAQALSGDQQARRDLIERLEGKPLARNENGEPGEFERLQIRLQVVRSHADSPADA